jgi:hypothetical protein
MTAIKKSLIALLISISCGFSVFAQNTEDVSAPKLRDSKISERPKDHFVLQLGTVNWLQKPDSVSLSGLARNIGVYFMFDLPFKTDPRFSIGAGVGVGSDHVVFDKNAGRDLIINSRNGFQFKKNEGADASIKYRSIKLHTAYLEAPVEFRFMSKPATPQKSFKAAIGMKIGTLITAVDKTKFEQDAAGEGGYNVKIKDRRNFNSLRLAATARIGYGAFGAFVQYQLNDFIKEGLGPNEIRPLQFGITISGL